MGSGGGLVGVTVPGDAPDGVDVFAEGDEIVDEGVISGSPRPESEQPVARLPASKRPTAMAEARSTGPHSLLNEVPPCF